MKAVGDTYLALVLLDVNELAALLSIVIIDVVLAGDNAIVVGMAASGLAAEHRRRVIVLGILIATVLRLGFASFATQLLAIIGLTLAGGVLLLWVSWKMYREIRASRNSRRPDMAPVVSLSPVARKTPRQALLRIVAADVSICRSTTYWRSRGSRATISGYCCSGLRYRWR